MATETRWGPELVGDPLQQLVLTACYFTPTAVDSVRLMSSLAQFLHTVHQDDLPFQFLLFPEGETLSR